MIETVNHMSKPTLQYGVYNIINTITHQYYVGSSSTSIQARFRSHKCDLRQNKHHCTHLQNAWNKYGEDAFIFEVIEYTNNKEKCIAIEQIWIDYAFESGMAYNICRIAGSCLGNRHSEETRRLQSEKKKGKPSSRRGVKLLPEHIQKLREVRIGKVPWNKGKPNPAMIGNKFGVGNQNAKGHVPSAETRALWSKQRKGRVSWNKGGILSKEHCEKLSKSHLGQTAWNKGIKTNLVPANKSNTEEFILKAQQKHGDKYDYSSATYTKSSEKVILICNTHGAFQQTPNKHLIGRGCSKCANEEKSKCMMGNKNGVGNQGRPKG